MVCYCMLISTLQLLMFTDSTSLVVQISPRLMVGNKTIVTDSLVVMTVLWAVVMNF